jgi:CcmD family protein
VTGAIQGGWEYVSAAYGVTWLFLGGYALSLVIRARRGKEKR